MRSARNSAVSGYLILSPSPKVFITGASSGIGAALAAHYAREGAILGLCARRLAPTQALFASLNCVGAT